jgi:hypothetical protein
MRQAGEASGNYIIISLKEYYGRFLDGLRVRPAWRRYLLTDLDETCLTEAILRPTRFEQYGPVCRRVAENARCGRVLPEPGDSVLPREVICATLRVGPQSCRAGTEEVRQEDVTAIGGIEDEESRREAGGPSPAGPGGPEGLRV